MSTSENIDVHHTQQLVNKESERHLQGHGNKEGAYKAYIKFYRHETDSFRCIHYKRACMIKNNCCNKWFICRFCHDENSDHNIDRHSIKEMKCLFCNQEQPPSRICNYCLKPLAYYYCDICHLWDDDQNKKIYHCEKCEICRVSQGEKYFHCDKCNACMNMSLKNNHRCIERNLESNCPICGEFMFTSIKTIILMKCGHCIHHACYREYVRNSYICPICLKSLGDMTAYFKKVDKFLESSEMPEEYKDTKALVFCNDCEKKTYAPYHFQYHKCQHCFSYNTAVIKIVRGP